MTGGKIILIPIRYPLTDRSIQTLTFANDLIDQDNEDEVYVLHVNLFQNGDDTHRREISRAITPLFDKCTPIVITRSGFLVEEIISSEATDVGADVVIIGKSQKSKWRRLLSSLLGNEPAIESFLQKQTTALVEVVE